MTFRTTISPRRLEYDLLYTELTEPPSLYRGIWRLTANNGWGQHRSDTDGIHRPTGTEDGNPRNKPRTSEVFAVSAG